MVVVQQHPAFLIRFFFLIFHFLFHLASELAKFLKVQPDVKQRGGANYKSSSTTM